MRNSDIIQQKIFILPDLLKQINRWRLMNKTISFTNGCFDILHKGHIFSLSQAASEADFLIVGVNADASVKKLKGENRPINNGQSRAFLLASLLMVDVVIIFEEDTPLNLINAILPDVLVKGGDYSIDEIVGAKEVIANGGKVVINPILQGFSTTALLEKIHRL
ncbi:MAG TPA: D-glycero-beta-D-manno-heptose 1-phosphate adenylyltransferase [Puia sp.]|jgi:rfaE bifunctional protein nucleotidyltransferase chain/domain